MNLVFLKHALNIKLVCDEFDLLNLSVFCIFVIGVCLFEVTKGGIQKDSMIPNHTRLI